MTRIGRLLAGTEKGSLDDVDRGGHERLIEAAEQSGVRRFVFVSAAGMEALPRIPIARSKLAVEKRLQDSRCPR